MYYKTGLITIVFPRASLSFNRMSLRRLTENQTTRQYIMWSGSFLVLFVAITTHGECVRLRYIKHSTEIMYKSLNFSVLLAEMLINT